MLTLTSLGTAGTVTGSKRLLGHEGHRILIDCGLFQGLGWRSPSPLLAPSMRAFPFSSKGRVDRAHEHARLVERQA